MPTMLKSLLLMSFCFSSFLEISLSGFHNYLFDILGPGILSISSFQPNENILSKDNSIEYLKIIDYDKNQTYLYTLEDWQLQKTINSTYDQLHFMYKPSSAVLEVTENWNLETGKVKHQLLQEISFDNPKINRNMEFPDGFYLDDNYFAFITYDSEEFNIADITSKNVVSFQLLNEPSNSIPFHYACEETTGLCVVGTESGKVYVYDYKDKREIDKFSIDSLLISQVIAIIPNSPYVVIEDKYAENKILNYKEKTLIKLDGDWERNDNYRTYPQNDGSNALFYKTWGGGFYGYAELIDVINRNTLHEYNCPSTNYPMELHSADISSDGQYVALGCLDNKGNEDSTDDSGVVFVFRTTNPNEIIHTINSIGLGITDNSSNYTNVEFYR